jgi:hypothetical protein
VNVMRYEPFAKRKKVDVLPAEVVVNTNDELKHFVRSLNITEFKNINA